MRLRLFLRRWAGRLTRHRPFGQSLVELSLRRADGRPGRHAHAFAPHSRGQSMVEFALVLPLMLFLMAIAADFGRLFYAYVAVQNAAKEGALYGSRTPLCVEPSSVACPNPNNVEWHVQNEASNLVSGGASLLTPTTTCWSPDLVPVRRQPINDCVPGDTYTVSVSYDFQLITPILSSVLGSGLTLTATDKAAVIGTAYDPSGIEALIWVDTLNSDPAYPLTGCTLADPGFSPRFYYAPCQNNLNQDQYLQFQEGQTITFKVRIKNTGNINLTALTYAYAVNGSPIATPTCSPSGSLATSLAKNADPSYCTFTLAATATGGTVNDMNVSIVAQGLASGVPTGDTSGGATVRVVPRPKLTVNLRAAPYRLGGNGNGSGGVASYPGGDLTLKSQATASDATLQSPTGWLLLTVSNSGGPGNSFGASITRNGSNVSLPGDCIVPATLDPGASFACTVPQSFVGNAATVNFAATASATNSQIIGGQQTVHVTTQDCDTSKRVMPNLVDTLTPSANKTNKTLAQAQAAWEASKITGTLTASPALPTDYFVGEQNVTAYTCVNANASAGVTIQRTQP
jgi:Flp pilus assembly protein TadG